MARKEFEGEVVRTWMETPSGPDRPGIPRMTVRLDDGRELTGDIPTALFNEATSLGKKLAGRRIALRANIEGGSFSRAVVLKTAAARPITANARFLDAQIRHAIAVSRLSTTEAQAILDLVDRSDADLLAKLEKRLVRGESFRTKRWAALRDDLKALRGGLWTEAHTTSRDRLVELAKAEQDLAKAMVSDIIPVQFDWATAPVATLRAIVTAEPFAAGPDGARLLSQWWERTSAADQRRILEAIQLGIAQQEPIQPIVSRVRKGLAMSRNNAESVVRTAVNHVSNKAREAFFGENSDLAGDLMWVSTLDGRTTPICRSRDHHFAPGPGRERAANTPRLDPPGARPPAHVSCRSTMVQVLDASAIADRMPERPFVRDTRTRRWRERDFREEAREAAGPAWKSMDRAQRTAAVRTIRKRWTAENIGQVPGKVSYDDWLRRQPETFQDEVLGPGRGKLFRAGLKMDKFVDRRGATLTLAELKERYSELVGG